MESIKEIDDIGKNAIDAIEKAHELDTIEKDFSQNSNETIDPPVEPRKRLSYCRLDISISAMLLLCTQYLISAVLGNQILYHTCTTIYEYNVTDCAKLGTKEVEGNEHLKKIEDVVQSYTSTIFMVRSLIEAIIPAIACLFLGPWSDKFGRKPVMILVASGYCLSYSIISLLAFISSYSEINPWLYVLALLPAALSGGTCSILSTFFAYISDLTTVEERPVRIGICGAYIAFGYAFGSLTGGYLYAATSALTVFIVAASLVGIAIVYTAFVVEESLKRHDVAQEEIQNRIRNLFKLTLIKEVFYSCCKKISGNRKLIVWGTLISMGLAAFVQDGGNTVGYLFVRQKFTMTVTEFTVYQAVNMVTIVVGAAFGLIVLHVYFKISEATLTVVSLLCGVCNSLIQALANETWELYLSVVVGCLSGLRMPMCQALLSRVIPSTDIGKVFSLSTALEAIAPLGSVPLYTYIYSETLTTYPGAYNFCSMGILVLSLIAMGFVLIAEIRSKRRGENLNC